MGLQSGMPLAVTGRVSILALILVLSSGCSVKSIAVNAMADAVSQSGSNYASDNDIEFVGYATPFGLKTMEGLLEEVPDHRGLLLATARGFTQYAYVYIEQPANELESDDVTRAYAQRDRARSMYLRARDYGLRGLAVNHASIDNIRLEPEASVSTTTVDDVPLLYWTAAAWASAISLSKDDPGTVADLPVVEALVRRAYYLHSDFNQGALHVFLLSFEMSMKSLREGAEERARDHFLQAVKLSDGNQAAPYVAYAEAISIANNDGDEFERMLNSALAVDINAEPGNRLANLVMQRRARWMLDNKDLYFLE